MFKIYDLNYKEVSLPVDDLGYGMKTPKNIGLDVEIGPVIYENIYSQSSYADKLVKRYPKDRTVSLIVSVISYHESDVDWRLKRDRVYAFFRNLGVFYVAEAEQPYKLLKVTIDADYNYDQLNQDWARAEIPLKIIDTPFKQSLHTTLDIDSEGVRWNDKWGYGMGLSSDSSEWKYKFTNTNPRFYNAGTEDIKLIQQKGSLIRLIPKESVPWLEISDGTTTFRLNRQTTIDSPLTLKGHQIRVNNANVLDQTNREFLTIKKGWNNWQIRGISKFEIEIDYRFLYD